MKIDLSLKLNHSANYSWQISDKFKLKGNKLRKQNQETQSPL